MTSSGSHKDLTKALTSFFQGSPSIPLPAEVNSIIVSYIDKHAKSDDTAADRLNDELLALWEKSILPSPQKYGPFLSVLRQLCPALRSPVRLFGWWERLFDPIQDHVKEEGGLARETMEYSKDLMPEDESIDLAEWGEDGLSPFVNRLTQRYVAIKDLDLHETWAERKCKIILDALLKFAKKDTKVFMMCLDGFFVKSRHRNSIIAVLLAFFSSEPRHVHVILQTPLFVSLLNSLQFDTSTRTVSGTLAVMTMVLPCIPSSLVPYLPTLFNIYARLLFWGRAAGFQQDHLQVPDDMRATYKPTPVDDQWEKVLMHPDQEGSTLDYFGDYFSLLYGLYPLNFADYLRKPQRYLRHANFAGDIDVDVQATEIRARTEAFRANHILHSNFYTFTLETEKTDMSRWIKRTSEAVASDCRMLDIRRKPGGQEIQQAAELQAAPGAYIGDETDDEETSTALLTVPSAINLQRLAADNNSIGTDSVETMSRDMDGDSPTLPPSPPSPGVDDDDDSTSSTGPPVPSFRLPITNSVPSLVSNYLELTGEVSSAAASLSPAHQGQVTPPPSSEMSESMAFLRYQNIMLQNDLLYERYMMQQHMIHMGELRKKQVKQAATEAETQNMITAHRSLMLRVEDAKRSEAQFKKEFDNRRNIAKRWESDLSNKLRALREEQKKWRLEEAALKRRLDEAEEECRNLRKMVAEAEGKQLESEQDRVVVDISTDTIEKLRGEIARLSASERALQGRELRTEKAAQEAEAASAKAAQAMAELVGREEQMEQERRRYETQIEELQEQLAAAKRESRPRERASDVASVYEGALAQARNKNAELNKLYTSLMRRYNALQATLLDRQCEAGHDADAESTTPVSGSPIAIRNRQHRGFSDPEVFDSSTPPAEHVSGSLGSPRPETPAGGSGGDGTWAQGKTSPVTERYLGRGGVQNSIKKERKEEKKDKGDKKDKKPSGSGLRGIRSFV